MADDPMADFLARERAALGQDADQFQTDSSAAPSPHQPSTGDAEAFAPALTESSSPSAATPSLAGLSVASPPASATPPKPPQRDFPGESAFQKEWVTKQREAVEERDRASQAKHDEVLEEARAAIDKFYEEYNERKDKMLEENRATQEIELQSAGKGTLWERVLKQVDLAAKSSLSSTAQQSGSSTRLGSPTPFAASQQQQQAPAARDTSRMRELLHDLRRDPSAPGAKPKKTEASAAA
ncbi:Clathrin light chain [Coemansia sp. RSA 552]|nr:Clathrin light chain [Coemansia sp. RSA 552]